MIMIMIMMLWDVIRPFTDIGLDAVSVCLLIIS